MKKFVCVLLILVLCIGATFALTACDNPTNSTQSPQNDNSNTIIDNSAKDPVEDFGLQFDTAYDLIVISEPNVERFTFHSDGTGEYYVYTQDKDGNETYNLTRHFIYEYMNKDKSEITIMITKTEFHGNSTKTNTFYVAATFKVSKNVLLYTYVSASKTYTYKYITAELRDRLESEKNK
ncbi:MAG: hypothetical protein K2G31_05890 [Clostridia bacterium]|nr:hypothetical protein [Clostridia bacterium]